ncbi:MAG: ROK family protein [Nanoarchaeota archaeon]|nr:ROK family protein [Nanoarchaeota archaeon]
MIIGIDLGGTHIKLGLVNNNIIIKKLTLNTEASKGKQRVINNIIKGISLIKEGQKIKAIGIGSPGPLDYKKGIIIKTPNLPFRNVNLKKIIKNKFRVKVEVDNDANCAALAEKIYGKYNKLDNFVVITLGTGIGSGAIFNGKLYHGGLFATEFGHMIIKGGKDHCHLNHYSCLESLASCSVISREAKKVFGKKMMAIEVIILCDKGNKKAKKIVDGVSKYLGIGLANIFNMLDPEIILIDKGLRGKGKYFLNKLNKEVKKNVMTKFKIAFSDLDDAGILGAAALVK